MARASQPLRRRLMAMMLLTATAAIVLTCLALMVYELITARRESLAQVATLARIVAANSTAALAFRDEKAAQEVLGALRAESSVAAAALYDEHGKIFATYLAPKMRGPLPLAVDFEGYRFRDDGLEGFEPVREQHRLGTLYIRWDTTALYEQFWLWGAIGVAAMAASLLLAYFLSRLFQARISAPVQLLADTASAVSERGDFSVRAPVASEGEFALLTSAFNHMLERIEAQNRTLQDNLDEREVAQRKLHTQLARLDLLHRTTRAIGERQDLDSIFNVILRSLEDNLPIDFGCACSYEPAPQRLAVVSIGARSRERARQLSIAIGTELLPVEQNGLAACVRGMLVYEPETDAVQFPVPQRFAAAGLHALVAAPLVVENHVFGVLLVARTARESFSSGDCEFLRQLSEHVALAGHQVRLYTQLEQAYRELRESQQANLQQERLRALGQMASGIAHDINNAISPVSLYTEVLLENERSLSEQARAYLRIIQRSIDDVGQTVTRMREFYRQRERQTDFVPVELNPLVQQVLALTRARWSDVPQERGVVIHIRTELAQDLPKASGTESEIRDALTNLIFNAVDAMPEGGTLTLRTQPGAAGQSVVLEVVDTGMGMDEETRRRCLEPFFTTKGERGTGMGLAMVYGMAQRHDAQIEIDSMPGAGTTFRLRFKKAMQAAAAARPAAQQPHRPLRLLVIDDDPLVGQSLYHVLRNAGHDVTAADGGQAGIDAFERAHRSNAPFDIVMTDLGMPYVDGRAVAAAVKALAPTTPVLLLTGWGQRLSTEQQIPENVDRLLSKPPKLAELSQVLAELAADKDLERNT